MCKHLLRLALLCVLPGQMSAAGSAAETPADLFPAILNGLEARCIGPANMGGRITSLAVVEQQPKWMYVASASGGLWKTLNNGTTWQPVFEKENTVSIGDVAVAPSDPNVVWIGTGEANPRNSVSWGDGVYRTTDGGGTWKHAGLKKTAHIGRVLVHPRNPQTAYVAALGRVWGPNPERGVYKTTNGGESWQQLVYLDENTGFIDLAMDSADPDTLYAAAYEIRRDAFSGGNPLTQVGGGAGLYKSSDGGESWYKMRLGLQDRLLGRCGIAISRSNPNILYAVVQTDKTDIRTVAGQAARSNSNKSTGGIFRSSDGGESWSKVNDLCPRPFYYGKIRVDPMNPDRIYVLGIQLHVSSDGGKTFRNDLGRKIHADHHALWINPLDPDHLILGGDGGLHLSGDGGKTWEHLQNLPIAQFYAVAVDMRRPYRVYGGLQDNGTWGGPSASLSSEGITTADWFRVMGMDGFHCQVDPSDPSTVYAEGQYGALRRINLRTGNSKAIRPQPKRGEAAYRFNWSAPIIVTKQKPHVLYFGGNYLFRSRDRGDSWEKASPDLTRGQPGTSANFGHTLTTIAVSPLNRGLIYAGSDDGRIHVSENDGNTWTDVSNAVPGVAAERCISRLECSGFAETTAYLAIDRHRNNDRRPYVFRTADRGQSWLSIAGNLPSEGPVHVIREDPRNPQLLYAGTEFGLYLSLDAGTSWRPFRKGFPTVAVHDLIVHPRDRELVIATHGRGIYIMDVAPLQELTPSVARQPCHLFGVKPVEIRQPRGSRGPRGDKYFSAPNPPAAAVIYYFLARPADKAPTLTIADSKGRKIRELTGSPEPGLHRILCPIRPADRGGSQSELRAGTYTAVLELPGQKRSSEFTVAEER